MLLAPQRGAFFYLDQQYKLKGLGQTPVGGLDLRICDSWQAFSWNSVVFSGCRNFLNRNAQTGNLFFASPLTTIPSRRGMVGHNGVTHLMGFVI